MTGNRVKPASYSIYAPLRFEVTRPYAKDISYKLGNKYYKNKEEPLNIIMRELNIFLKAYLNIRGYEYSKILALSELPITEAYAYYFKGGRVIYDIHSSLIHALAHTDVDKLTLSTIPTIQQSFYLHFGEIGDILPECGSIEGAYVSWVTYATTRTLQVCLVKSKTSSLPVQMTNIMDEMPTVFHIDVSETGKLISDQIEERIADKAEQTKDFKLDEQFKNATDRGIRILTTTFSKLVVNCLFYLQAAQDDVEERWDDRAPYDLVNQSLNAVKIGTRNTADRTLTNQDYIKIKLVGRKFARTMPTDSTKGEGGHKSTHMRRGHFRNQAYGAEHSLRKIVFIPPMIINADDDDAPGRIYTS